MDHFVDVNEMVCLALPNRPNQSPGSLARSLTPKVRGNPESSPFRFHGYVDRPVQGGPSTNDDATLTSALLDRLLDHVETVLIEGKSYRSQDHAEI